MKRLNLVICFLVLTFASCFANEYTINDQKVDAMFNAASEISISSLSATTQASNPMMVSADNDTKLVTAVVVNFFLGGFGIHRHILGTSKPMFLYYTITVCGIFGIVPTVDFFVLIIDGIINKNGSKYMNNDKYFMWL